MYQPGPSQPARPLVSQREWRFSSEDWQPASRWRRFGAFALDYLFVIVLVFGGLELALKLDGQGEVAPEPRLYEGIWAAPIVIIPFILVLVIFPLWKDASPAKLLLRIKVVHYQSGGRPGPWRHLLRFLALIADSFWYIGAFLILFTRDHRRVGDRWAGTIVVSASSVSPGHRILMGDGTALVTGGHSGPHVEPSEGPVRPRNWSGSGVRLSGRPPDKRK